MSRMLAIITKKSKIFHPDKKYPFPKVHNFKTASMMKIKLKAKFILSKTYVV
jgi:hypothetical protein